MKVLCANVSAECNEHISHTVSLDEFRILTGEKCLGRMHIKDIFEAADIEPIGALYAAIPPNGMIQKEAAEWIEEQILESIRQNIHDIDGIYLQLHGASGVDGLDTVSLEHDLLPKIRHIAGKFMPIAMVMDPHGNLTKELAEQVNIVSCYRESPHFDQVEMEQKIARKFISLLNKPRYIKPAVCKIPILVGGERSVSAYEPMKSINHMLNELEKDERVLCASYHIGYIRHDDDKLGAAVAVVPSDMKYAGFCQKACETISQYAWDHREEFQFSGHVEEVPDAVKKALDYPDKTVVITDSGDNCGAGGYGQNTILLREILKQAEDTPARKKILIAGINDPKTHARLKNQKPGDYVSISLGVGEDEDSAPVNLEGKLVDIGFQMYGSGNIVGDSYLVRVKNTDIEIDILVLDHNIQYGSMKQFEAAKAPFHDYDIVVVKMGYLDYPLVPETAYHIMALSAGPTIQRSENIPFHKIFRPMWPMDRFEDSAPLMYIDR